MQAARQLLALVRQPFAWSLPCWHCFRLESRLFQNLPINLLESGDELDAPSSTLTVQELRSRNRIHRFVLREQSSR